MKKIAVKYLFRSIVIQTIAAEVPRNLFDISYKPIHKQEKLFKEDLQILHNIFWMLQDCASALEEIPKTS